MSSPDTPAPHPDRPLRTLHLVLGDQLARDAAALDALDPAHDAIWMAEVAHEIERVPSHQRRIVLFLSAMRHFRDDLRARGFEVHYHELTPDPEADRGSTFSDVLRADLARLDPQRVSMTRAGDWQVQSDIEATLGAGGTPLEVLEDDHFICSRDDFEGWIEGRRRILLEDFYRWMRKREGVLMTPEGDPVGEAWNFDQDNRESFGAQGPGELPPVPRFAPDAITQAVIDLVKDRWASHPGSAEGFAEPVTPAQARAALEAFVTERLPDFGRVQDALWTGEQELFHSRLSAALNLKLLDPREVIARAEAAWSRGRAPLNSVEGFIRQVLGWREYVRGLYEHFMPEYAGRNALECTDRDVPSFFWDGDTDMVCVADAMDGVLRLGYAHHIQRLMVLGLFAQLAGVHPYRFHEWHMALYLDAIDWVSLPNTLGMSQFGDGGIMGSKPYCASGRYIDRQGPYCRGCRYDPAKATGPKACPFTTLYWDFLARHHERFVSNGRMKFQLRNLERKKPEELAAIRQQADTLLERIDAGERV
jgi:deoxyribodipyrimidine photolyase-related protein